MWAFGGCCRQIAGMILTKYSDTVHTWFDATVICLRCFRFVCIYAFAAVFLGATVFFGE